MISQSTQCSAPLADWLQDSLYQGYAYSYPHKQAYRPLENPVPLESLWNRENKESLFLYAHIPFCEMRCGFCNLFTTTNPKGNLVERYLDSLELEAESIASFLKPHHFSRGAIGGGTPSFLNEKELTRLFAILRQTLGGLHPGTPLSFETSPATITREKLAFLREHGVTRLSIGVQSLIHEETRQLGRPQKIPVVETALSTIREANFPIFNLDLIYGIGGQTKASWAHSLQRALEFSPEELYLYPLYVRPLTGLHRIGREPNDLRLDLYRQARDMLLEKGYRQISMRLFRKSSLDKEDQPIDGPVYCCQEDGMLGLGAGARSYTKDLHYSTDYAVGRASIDEIIDLYTKRTAHDHTHATYGCHLPLEEQHRRFVLKSLLRFPGLDLGAYQSEFGTGAFEDLPDLHQLLEHKLAIHQDNHVTLTPSGMERSDLIGPWLTSPAINAQMNSFQLR